MSNKITKDDDDDQNVEDILAKFIVSQGVGTDRNAVDFLLRQQGIEQGDPLKIWGPGVYWFIGKTMSGKTEALKNLLTHLDMVKFTVRDEDNPEKFKQVPVAEIIYFYTSEWQSHPFDELEQINGVRFIKLEPTAGYTGKLCQDRRPRIIILDDMLQHVTEDDSIVQLITRQVHHLNIMVCITMQVLHPRGKNAVGLRSQGHGYFFFNHTNDKAGLLLRFKQFLTDNKKVDKVMAFYIDAINRPGGYMYVDCHQLQSRDLPYKFFSRIFPNEGITEACDLE